MPRCAVLTCGESGAHIFPKDMKLCQLWLKAIRRENLIPTKATRLCRNHFLESDYIGTSIYTGVEHTHRYLKKGVVPSIFTWSTEPLSEEAKAKQDKLKAHIPKRKRRFAGLATSQYHEDEVPLEEDDTMQEEYLDSNIFKEEVEFEGNPDSPNNLSHNVKDQKDCGTQTSNISRLISTEVLLADNETVQFYTGLESPAKFSLVLSTLLPMANNLKYRWNKVVGMSIEDQFLMLLIKLKRNTTDFELSKIFGVSKSEVCNIIVTWINFVSDIWSLVDIWPSQKLISFYMPNCFKKYYPSTRVIIDETDICIENPSQPNDHQAPLCTYEHKKTLKFLVGASPGGLLTYVSSPYGGSVSERQRAERALLEICDDGDSIIQNRMFNVQVHKGIEINIPKFFTEKLDQELTSERVHIERLKVLTKSYIILSDVLEHFYAPLATKIVSLCVMLSNFKEETVNKNC